MHRICARLLIAVIQSAVIGAAPAGHTALRIANARIANTVNALLLRSPTFTDMVRRLDESNVIVYVVPETCPKHSVQSCLTLIGEGGGYRYMRISIPIVDPQATIAARLAHEVRHALEIADEPAVTDLPTLAEFYRRIGYAVERGDVYETADAKAAEQLVSREFAAPVARRRADGPR